MKNQSDFHPSTPEILTKLKAVREKRRFNPKEYIKIKAQLIHNYMVFNGLKGCTIGISGGIDSAVCYYLLKEAKKLGQIEHIWPICLPCYGEHNGVSNQKELSQRVELLEGGDLDLINIASCVNELRKKVERNSTYSEWANGQIIPPIRTNFLYYAATLMNDRGVPSIIIGTTNRDEWAVGYVGKYSDGLVDLQIISDLHKSEVRLLAKELNVPKEIIDVKPSGDMFDGRSDEEIFGFDYDALELYINEPFEGPQADNIKKLHKYNSHKFKVGSPAVHLNIYEGGTKDGLPLEFESKYWADLEKQGDIIKPQFVAPMNFAKLDLHEGLESYIFGDPTKEIVYGGLLTYSEQYQLVQLFDNSTTKAANIFGYTNQKGKKGSDRASLYNIELAKIIWDRIKNNIPHIVQADVPTTDWEEGEAYRVVGINPLFRFINYENGGELVAHYDGSSKIGQYKTLASIVIYLTDNETGATAFLEDNQSNDWNKNLSDQPNYIGDSYKKYLPRGRFCVMFPHYLLHEGEMAIGERKLIIRTDIVAEKIKYS